MALTNNQLPKQLTSSNSIQACLPSQFLKTSTQTNYTEYTLLQHTLEVIHQSRKFCNKTFWERFTQNTQVLKLITLSQHLDTISDSIFFQEQIRPYLNANQSKANHFSNPLTETVSDQNKIPV